MSDSKRPRQANVVWVTMAELTEALGIPGDHLPMRLLLSAEAHDPAIGIMIEGPSCHLFHARSPISYVSLDEFRKDLDFRRDLATTEYGPYWPEKGFGT